MLTIEQVDRATDAGAKFIVSPGFDPEIVDYCIDTIRALAAPYKNIKFMPTGGINAANLERYLSYDRIVACGGSWMVKADLIRNGEFDEVKKLTAEAVRLVSEIRSK